MCLLSRPSSSPARLTRAAGTLTAALIALTARGETPAVQAASCEVGHLAPDWRPRDWATTSPVADRCITLDSSLASIGDEWSFCGGLRPGTGDVLPVPFLCPPAPGGLALGKGKPYEGSRRWGQEVRSVRLDCPGRYVARADGGVVSVVLEDAGPAACETVRTDGWGYASEGLALPPRGGSEPAALSRLPPELQRAPTADWSSGMNPGEGHGMVNWQTGAVSTRIGGYDLRLGPDAAWNDLEVSASPDRLAFDHAAVRIRNSLLTTPEGEVVEFGTWSEGWFDDSGGGLFDSLAFRLPASRACGVSLEAGTLATLWDLQDPTAPQRTCRKRPTTQPDRVVVGPDWIYLDWDEVPPASRSAVSAAERSSFGEQDYGCEITCKTR